MMMFSMSTTDPAYRNLIHFVPEQPRCSQTENVKEQVSTEHGQDIKGFYEALVGISESSVSMKHQSNKQNDATSNGHGSGCMVKQENQTGGKSQRRKRKKTGWGEDNVTPAPINIKKEPLCRNGTGEEEAPAYASSTATSVPLIYPTRSTFGYETLTRFERKHFKFLQAAQLGDPVQVSKLLAQGVSLNYKDFYGWTALMCAAKEGQDQVVMCLLNHGADSTLLNNEGLSASCLARLAGHTHLASAISSYTPAIAGTQQSHQENTTDSFFCSKCKEHFSENERRAHFTSTVHLFNCGRKHQHPAYLLPETNRGFQMLLRTGWQVDKGLGPDGKGVKYPVKTVLKRDREGLGNDSKSCEKRKAKITHFNPHDDAAVNSVMLKWRRNISVRKSAQVAMKSKEKRERRKERNFRLEFNDL